MWLEFVIPCSESFFSGYSGFPVSSKNQHFQIPILSGLLSTLCHEPLARVIALALPVFDIKFAFTLFFTLLACCVYLLVRVDREVFFFIFAVLLIPRISKL